MMNDDEKFNMWLQESAKGYNAPGATPREEMWAQIKAARVRRPRPWLRWGLAAAAVLLVGIAIGRWTMNQHGGPLVAHGDTIGDTTARALVYQLAATQYLSRTETFLTGFRADLRAGRADAFPGQARDLLETTRLLLDSPAADDARMRTLLEDLELVLVQIGSLRPAGRNRSEIDLIDEGLEQRAVFSRLRSAIPSGPLGTGVRAAL